MFQDYLLAKSIPEAVSVINQSNGQARFIAGGTDLLLDLASNKVQANTLVDISQIQDLKQIIIENGLIRIGAAVTHNQAAKSGLVQANAPALAQAARKIGSLQIRNIGTVIGNIVNGQPAADTAVALVALGASVEILSSSEVKFIPIEKMYADIGKSVIDSTCQLVTYIHFQAQLKNQGSAFLRLEQRKALALPMLNTAVMVSIEDNNFQWVRIAMAPVGSGPVRAIEAEELLKGAPINSEIIDKAAKLAVTQANPRSSALRGSKEYRLDMLPVLVKRALEMAIKQAESNK